MIRVYNYMAAGVALTGVVAWFAYQAAGGDQIQIIGRQVTGLTAFGHAIFAGPLMWAAPAGAARPGDAAELRHQPAVGRARR